MDNGQQEILRSLKGHLKDKGLSQAELSRRLGFTRPYTTMVLSEKKVPGEKFLRAAEEYLKTGESKIIPDNTSATRSKRNTYTAPALEHHLHHKVQELGERLMDLEGITSWNHLVTHLIKEEGLRQGLFGELEEIYGKRVTKGERLDFHHSQMDKAKSVFRRAQRVLEDAEREIARLEAGEPEEKIDVDMTKGKD